ncbi:hypothetical protein ACPJHQ_04120 [Rossellomorea sp. H39__3]
MEFAVENHSTASRSSIKDEVTHAYEAIMGEVKGDYNPASPISLEFHNKKDISFSTRDEVVLFKDQGHFLTVHELSHALLWGKEEQDDRGYWALEGLAIHLQMEYGDPVYPNYDVPPRDYECGERRRDADSPDEALRNVHEPDAVSTFLGK